MPVNIIAQQDETLAADARARTLLPAQTLKALTKASELRSLSTIAFQYAAICCAAFASEWSGSWAVTFVALVFIATRQHAVAVMMHDAAHHLLSRRKWLNDLIACLFCSFPLFVSMGRYRANHLDHHRKTNNSDDPDLGDNTHPGSPRELMRVLLADLCLLSLPKQMRRARKFGVLGIFREDRGKFTREQYLLVAFVAVVVIACCVTSFGYYLVLYWFLPFFTVCQVILRFRGFSEHAGRMSDSYLNGSRSIKVGWLERLIFAPCNVNRHLEHHLYPSVPSHNLEKLHEELQQNERYRDTVRPTDGYLRRNARSVLGELYRRPTNGGASA